ncbi:MAG TPA: hypothetical protein VMG98_16190 [Verrucomicrobiae bacterium]|nr:hypothetical protein [Verrucomicrobiae bacterium]
MKAALVGVAGALASFLAMYAICVRAGLNASPAILAAALAVGLARRPEGLELRATAARLVALPLVALAAALVGLTLRTLPLFGALLFCMGVTLSIWLRNFGERGAAIGRTIALPFLTMLVVPIHVDAARPGLGALLVIAAGAIAFVCSYAARRLA